MFQRQHVKFATFSQMVTNMVSKLTLFGLSVNVHYVCT